MARASLGSARLAWAKMPLEPSLVTCSRVSLALASLPWKLMATFAPSRASSMAMARPMPREAPVTSAVFPAETSHCVISPSRNEP